MSTVQRALHTGAYQMPIFFDMPEVEPKSLLTYKDYLKLERIPTASVLLRIDYASVDEDGVFISINDRNPKKRALAYDPPQDYNTGAYSTLYYIVSEEERDLYAIRKKRKYDFPLLEVM